MPIGYLVTLGNGTLDTGDGVWDGDGQTYNNINDTGVFFEATDGNLYFVPDTWFITSGSATVASGPAYTAPGNGTVDGTAGDDVIDDTYSDPEFETVTSGNDVIDAGAGNDTAYGGGGDDSILGGDGADVLVGDQTAENDGQDTISGGIGNDTIYGDSAAGTDNSPTFVSWADQGLADETSVAAGTTALSTDGNINIDVTVTAEANFYGASVETGDPLYDYNGANDLSSLAIEGGDIPTGGTVGNDPNAAIVRLDFSAATGGYCFELWRRGRYGFPDRLCSILGRGPRFLHRD